MMSTAATAAVPLAGGGTAPAQAQPAAARPATLAAVVPGRPNLMSMTLRVNLRHGSVAALRRQAMLRD